MAHSRINTFVCVTVHCILFLPGQLHSQKKPLNFILMPFGCLTSVRMFYTFCYHPRLAVEAIIILYSYSLTIMHLAMQYRWSMRILIEGAYYFTQESKWYAFQSRAYSIRGCTLIENIRHSCSCFFLLYWIL